MARGKKSSKKAKRTYRRRISRRPRIAGMVKKIVRQAIARNVENKRLTTEFTKNLFHSGAGTNFRDQNIIALCPNSALGSIYQMVQGTGQQQRIGNQVRLKKLIFRGIMAPNPYSATTNPTPNPVMIQMFIISMKRNVPSSSIAEVNNVFQNTFFANGSTSLGALGTLYDAVTPINTDQVTLHYKRTFKLGYENYSGVTGGADTGQTKASNDYKLNQRFSINLAKYMTKVWKFNDNEGATTSRQVYAIFQPLNFNGSIPAVGTTPAGLIAGVDVFYEDA